MQKGDTMSELGNQLNSQTLDQVLASTFATVGGRVFPDTRSEQGLSDFIAVVNAWRATHAQTYGNVLPNTGTAYADSLNSSPATLVEVADNETIKINAISIENSGGDPAGVKILLGDAIVYSGDIPPAAAGGAVGSSLILTSPIVMSKGQSLTASLTSGTGSDITVNVSAVKCAQ